MPRKQTYLVTHVDAFGNTLAIARRQHAYVVGTVSSHGRLIPCGAATFWTMAHAQQRFEQEVRDRQSRAQTT